MSPGRFDYVKYDHESTDKQKIFKDHVEELDRMIQTLECPRSVEYAIKALEESYMWIGKALRNEQIKRNGSAELQEERCDTHIIDESTNSGVWIKP